MCFRLWSHYTAGYLFMAPREATRYKVNTYMYSTCDSPLLVRWLSAKF